MHRNGRGRGEAAVPDAAGLDVEQVLEAGEIEVEGRLVEASNLALRVWLTQGDQRLPAVYKPISGERDLWDFPDGTLAGRERATYLVARAGGWTHIPETVLRDGPLGSGSVQRWVGPLEPTDPISLVRLDPVRELESSFLPVVALELADDGPVALCHADDPRLASLAVLDAVLNNADRKGSHLIEDGDHLWAIDHGLTFHPHAKLRTILWGWAGDPFPADDLQRLARLDAALAEPDLIAALAALLTPVEVTALRNRVSRLAEEGVFPEPPQDRTPLPWPLW
ncbi:SCO1664 family protein [Luteipulveratus flavus]|uniref:SCO1664 family protein n=1 Tax=Luteipulveratus flavus TaxID=3031728 RepID=A0ABT6CAI8_9MICO|nr:SCO1664 family protein [Luteipulveratus sp. YIM 133296]MDF8265898.1 SCO1664 family protein [Luteipulveratus sp. YIM 133296]